ncbi:hypothetical protein [Patulibacter sp.]|uniref:hypothetical protein n=1 Tax=Patulibacter sp. TaxID=1912859 RepID=UPI00271C7E6E|nr:hypothetical protein [Patulibacter sp.]MDO9407650.1 hypothetical protein [Patulibacter sp.]
MSRVRLFRLLLAALAALALAVGGLPHGTEPAQAATCAQFATQAAAQAAANTRDGDGDGIYCESLPCPCAGPAAPAPAPSEPAQPPAPAPQPAPASPTTPTPTPDPTPTVVPGSADPAGCTVVGRVVDVGLSRTKYPAVRKHWERAIRKGYPRVLTINRAGASGRRSRLLSAYATAPGRDRDEYPMAMARTTVRADVALVDSSQNRGAGAVQGIKLRRYCSGQRFRIVWY